MYLRFFWPGLVGVGDEDGGGRVGDVGEIRRTDKSLEDDAEVVNVCGIDVKGSGVCDGVKTPIEEEDAG